jgi:hypothetical protein
MKSQAKGPLEDCSHFPLIAPFPQGSKSWECVLQHTPVETTERRFFHLASNKILSAWNLKHYPEHWQTQATCRCRLSRWWVHIPWNMCVSHILSNTLNCWYVGQPEDGACISKCCLSVWWSRQAPADVAKAPLSFARHSDTTGLSPLKFFCSQNSKGVLDSVLYSGPYPHSFFLLLPPPGHSCFLPSAMVPFVAGAGC